MRMLITGGAGFLGSHLCERLHRDGHEIICVDNLITANPDNIAALLGQTRFTHVVHDVSRPYTPDGSIDFILHFASPASPIDYLKHPIPTLKVGALGTHNTLGMAKAKGAKFLLASTSEVYGDPQVHPQPESYWGHVNPVGPRGVYDEAKRFAEALTMAYHRSHGVDTRIVRIFNTYGPRMRMHDGRAIPAFITQALRGEAVTVFGDGSQTRSFCFVDDLIEGIVRLMHSDYDEPMNIGNPGEYTVRQLAEEIIRMTKSPSRIESRPLPQDDPKQRCPDIGAASRVLGWQPKTALAEGLTKTIAWFRTQLERT
ncbi:MAG TPA: UDP-glucuronic acid decarboxylase family protein [bacterium]